MLTEDGGILPRLLFGVQNCSKNTDETSICAPTVLDTDISSSIQTHHACTGMFVSSLLDIVKPFHTNPLASWPAGNILQYEGLQTDWHQFFWPFSGGCAQLVVSACVCACGGRRSCREDAEGGRAMFGSCHRTPGQRRLADSPLVARSSRAMPRAPGEDAVAWRRRNGGGPQRRLARSQPAPSKYWRAACLVHWHSDPARMPAFCSSAGAMAAWHD